MKIERAQFLTPPWALTEVLSVGPARAETPVFMMAASARAEDSTLVRVNGGQHFKVPDGIVLGD